MVFSALYATMKMRMRWPARSMGIGRLPKPGVRPRRVPGNSSLFPDPVLFLNRPFQIKAGGRLSSNRPLFLGCGGIPRLSESTRRVAPCSREIFELRAALAGAALDAAAAGAGSDHFARAAIRAGDIHVH